MNKLKFLFALLLSFAGAYTAWAWDPVEDAVYTIKANGSSVYITTNEVAEGTGDVSSYKTYGLLTTAEQFRFIASNGRWKIQSVSSSKYIGKNTGNRNWNVANEQDEWVISETSAGVFTIFRSNENKGLGWNTAANNSPYFTDKGANNTWNIQRVIRYTYQYFYNGSQVGSDESHRGYAGEAFAAVVLPSTGEDNSTYGVMSGAPTGTLTDADDNRVIRIELEKFVTVTYTYDYQWNGTSIATETHSGGAGSDNFAAATAPTANDAIYTVIESSVPTGVLSEAHQGQTFVIELNKYAKVSYTYVYKSGEEQISTESHTGYAGRDNYAEPTAPTVTGGYFTVQEGAAPTGLLPESVDGTEIIINLTGGYYIDAYVSPAPVDGEFVEGTKWYHYKITHNGYYITTSEGQIDDNGFIPTRTEKPSVSDAEALWCIVGNRTDGFQLYNKAQGASVALGFSGWQGSGGGTYWLKMLTPGEGSNHTKFALVGNDVEGPFKFEVKSMGSETGHMYPNYYGDTSNDNKHNHIMHWSNPDSRTDATFEICYIQGAVDLTPEEMESIDRANAVIAELNIVGGHYRTSQDNYTKLYEALANTDVEAINEVLAEVEEFVDPITFDATKRYVVINNQNSNYLCSKDDCTYLCMNNNATTTNSAEDGAKVALEFDINNENFHFCVVPVVENDAIIGYVMYNVGNGEIVKQTATSTGCANPYWFIAHSTTDIQENLLSITNVSGLDHVICAKKNYQDHTSSADANKVFLHDGNADPYHSGACNWSGNTPGSYWIFREIGDAPTNLMTNVCAQLKASVKATKPNIAEADVQNAIGFYTADVEPWIVDNLTSNDPVDYFNFVTNFPTTLDNYVNKPTVGFYRLKAASDNYIQANGSQYVVSELTNDNEAGAIWYLNEDNQLVNYNKGLGFSNTFGQAEVGALLTVDLTSANLARPALALCAGGQYMNENNGTIAAASTFSASCAWTFELVEQLPVSISAAKYATLYSPKVLTPAEGEEVTIYTAEVRGDVLHLTESDVVPANRGVVLYRNVQNADGEVVRFDVDIEGSVDASGVQSILEGTCAMKDGNTADFVLSIGTVNGQRQVGFFPVRAGEKMAGFKAYLAGSSLADEGNVNEIRAFSFSFDDITTAITASNTTMTEGVMYNINGQQVMRAGGLVIVNGKKIMVN